MNIFKIYLLFWIFSCLGWLMEVMVCSIEDKKLVNRGFLIGPYCPIYGFGALLMLSLAPYKDNPLVLFILSLVLCSVLEYLTSYLMEKMFKVRWWDYSRDSFNINGRVCLRNAIAFGALGLLFVRYLNPFFLGLMDNFDDKTITILVIVVFIITFTDIIVSFMAMTSIKKKINKNEFKNRDATLDIKNLIHKVNTGYLERRLIKTYHLLEKEREIFINKIESLNNKTKSGYGIILLFVFLGFVIGLFLSVILKLDSYKIIIPFTVSLCALIAIIILKVGNK